MPAPHLSKGRWAELTAQAHFVRRGWSVFQAVSHHGVCDLVVARAQGAGLRLVAVEVKFLDLESDRSRRPKAPPGCTICYVAADGSVECELTSGRSINADD